MTATQTTMAASGAARWADRAAAGRCLAEALAAYRGAHALVLAVPRGGAAVGRAVADALGAELDVVLARRLRAPVEREASVGTIDELGWSHVVAFADRLGVEAAYLEQERTSQLELLRHRRAAYTPARGALPVRGRTVILVDDGVLSGETLYAALEAVRARRPARLVCAVPVAAAAGLARLHGLADEMVCLVAPAGDCVELSGHFTDFAEVSDAQVAGLLERASRHGG